MCIRDSSWTTPGVFFAATDQFDLSVDELLNNFEFSADCTSSLLYTSDAADERSSVDLGGRRIIKKNNQRDELLDQGIKQDDTTQEYEPWLTSYQNS